jgi:uncharacterized membrane protein YqiK
LAFDPFDEFMRDGAQLWTRLTPHWRSFEFQELSPETKRLREEALHSRRLRAQENQMNRADARQRYFQKLRCSRKLLKAARVKAAEKKKEEETDNIRRNILLKIAQEKELMRKSLREPLDSLVEPPPKRQCRTNKGNGTLASAMARRNAAFSDHP